MHIVLYLYAQISSLSLLMYPFRRGGTTLHKGNQKQVLLIIIFLFPGLFKTKSVPPNMLENLLDNFHMSLNWDNHGMGFQHKHNVHHWIQEYTAVLEHPSTFYSHHHLLQNKKHTHCNKRAV